MTKTMTEFTFEVFDMSIGEEYCTKLFDVLNDVESEINNDRAFDLGDSSGKATDLFNQLCQYLSLEAYVDSADVSNVNFDLLCGLLIGYWSGQKSKAIRNDSTPKPIIVIEVCGGLVTETTVSAPIDVEILDWDNWNDSGGEDWRDLADSMDEHERDFCEDYERIYKLQQSLLADDSTADARNS